MLNRESIKKSLSKEWKMVCSASKHDLSSDSFPALERCWSLSGETSTSSSSTTTPSFEPEDASAKRIRAKYFYALGIGKPKLPLAPLHGSNKVSNQAASLPNVHQRIRSILKISRTTPVDPTPTPSKGLFLNNSNSNQGCSRKESKVVFKTDVSIHVIPSRHQISLKEKELLWMMPQELEETAYRNYIEFSLEQWDWQQAIEEKDFVLLQGILTHPAHVVMMQQQQLQMHCTPNRQFCRIFSAQQHLRQQQQHHHHHHHPQYRYTASSQSSMNYR